MSRSVHERLQDILHAINRARIADKRMRLAQSLADDVGLQIAFEAILHNLFVIGEAVKSLPPEMLAEDPELPWNEIAAMRDVIGHRYHRIVPDIVHRTVEEDLVPLEAAVRRLLRRR
ncbi:MAG: DUF86 domain-containing protein [bacterium]